ncbi:hypothetical protein ARMGADRAFT_475893 [Armillaria gallica]|uniref:Uncharacterized protein n=1 Tax=Armillaria gallica TaxID=47427 RepID=A0A2H3CZW9_ARMGA|nr:hypothetical protein ARMGADRAFT_475893 [Armillaria gallica]
MYQSCFLLCNLYCRLPCQPVWYAGFFFWLLVIMEELLCVFCPARVHELRVAISVRVNIRLCILCLMDKTCTVHRPMHTVNS